MNVNAWLALHSSYRAIINHFTPKIDSWAAVNHLTSMTSEQVCTLLRDQSFYRLGVGGFKGDHLVFRGEWRGNQSSSTEYERGTIENSQPVNCLGGVGVGEAWEYYVNLTVIQLTTKILRPHSPRRLSVLLSNCSLLMVNHLAWNGGLITKHLKVTTLYDNLWFQVLGVIRSNYDTLTLKLQDNLDHYEKYSEKPKEAAFFTQLVSIHYLVVNLKRTAKLDIHR